MRLTYTNRQRPSIHPPLWICISLLFFILTILPAFASGQKEIKEQNQTGGAWIIPIKGDIDRPLLVFIRRELVKARSHKAEWLIFDIDTFGGRVDSALQISSLIGSVQDAKTVAWVRSGPDSMGVSWSAGALIAFSCQEIYMAEGTSMGAAAPIVMGPGGESVGAGEKTVSALRSQVKALAEKNGHPALLALAMVDYDINIWEIEENGERNLILLEELERAEKDNTRSITRLKEVSAPGKLLSLSAKEAQDYGLSRGYAGDREELFKLLEAGELFSESAQSISDRIVSFLASNVMRSLLILVGLIALYLELQAPGFGVFGVTAIIAFLIVFGSGALLGTVGSLEILLFIVGLALLAVEIFLIPGFGVVGISGIICIALAFIFSMQDFVIPTLPWHWELMGKNALTVGLSLFASVIVIAVLLLSGQKFPIFTRLTLDTAITESAQAPLEGEFDGPEIQHPLIGKNGVAQSALRPIGKARIEDKLYDVTLEEGFCEAGTNIVVHKVLGNIITVRLFS